MELHNGFSFARKAGAKAETWDSRKAYPVGNRSDPRKRIRRDENTKHCRGRPRTERILLQFLSEQRSVCIRGYRCVFQAGPGKVAQLSSESGCRAKGSIGGVLR